MWRVVVGCSAAAVLLVSCGEAPPPPPEPAAETAAAGAEKADFPDIVHAYHGLLLDAERKEIKLDKAVIEGLQDSLLASLTAAPAVEKTAENRLWEQGAKAALDKAHADKVLSGFDFTDDERILVKSTLIRKAINAVPEQERREYQWRFDLIHERSQHYLRPKFRELRPELVRYLSSFEDLLEWLRRLLEILFPTAYISDCRANSVPIPPDWPTGWTNQGDLPFDLNFIQSGTDTEVWTYQDPGGLGLCYALPRQDAAGFIDFLGIICQSESTGKACFWDNIDAATGARIQGVGITLRISRLKDGYSLAENCTNCHRGYNVFLIHPTTPLGAPADRDPAVRYTPIGQPAWSNPPAFAAVGAGACSGCHEIAALNPSICAFLQLAAEKTMPSPADPAGWASPDPPYAAHITAIQAACGGGPPPPRPCPDGQQCCGNEEPGGGCDGQCWPSGDPCP